MPSAAGGVDASVRLQGLSASSDETASQSAVDFIDSVVDAAAGDVAEVRTAEA